jgi:hypothetical protein
MTLLKAWILMEIMIWISCDGCVYGKHHDTPISYNNGGFRAKKILGLVHTNLCGPMVTSHERAKYFLTFINDFFRKTFFYIMKIKFGMFDKLKVFKNLIKNQIGKKIKMIWCDGGGEYNLKNFNAFCKENGIVKWTNTPYTLKQNGVV